MKPSEFKCHRLSFARATRKELQLWSPVRATYDYADGYAVGAARAAEVLTLIPYVKRGDALFDENDPTGLGDILARIALAQALLGVKSNGDHGAIIGFWNVFGRRLGVMPKATADRSYAQAAE